MRRQLGFNLIEALIALLVISVGLLGMAALQATSLKQNQSAYQRSQATLLAYDIVDRIRANEGALTGYFAASGAENAACVSYSGAASGTCSALNMASHDVWEWQQSLARELTSGGGRVCRDSTASSAVSAAGSPDCGGATSDPIVVYVWWNDERESDGSLSQFNVNVEL